MGGAPTSVDSAPTDFATCCMKDKIKIVDISKASWSGSSRKRKKSARKRMKNPGIRLGRTSSSGTAGRNPRRRAALHHSDLDKEDIDNYPDVVRTILGMARRTQSSRWNRIQNYWMRNNAFYGDNAIFDIELTKDKLEATKYLTEGDPDDPWDEIRQRRSSRSSSRSLRKSSSDLPERQDDNDARVRGAAQRVQHGAREARDSRHIGKVARDIDDGESAKAKPQHIMAAMSFDGQQFAQQYSITCCDDSATWTGGDGTPWVERPSNSVWRRSRSVRLCPNRQRPRGQQTRRINQQRRARRSSRMRTWCSHTRRDGESKTLFGERREDVFTKIVLFQRRGSFLTRVEV